MIFEKRELVSRFHRKSRSGLFLSLSYQAGSTKDRIYARPGRKREKRITGDLRKVLTIDETFLSDSPILFSLSSVGKTRLMKRKGITAESTDERNLA